MHVPVMMTEVMEGLNIQTGGLYWDGTFGRGGHSRRILEQLSAEGRLIGTDRDEEAAAEAATLNAEPRFSFLRGSLEDVFPQIPEGLSGFLWDLGCSTPQLEDAERGFTFRENGPLDMRMDREQELTAETLVNGLPEKELADLIYQYGEERFSRRIAARILLRRKEERIVDTQTLAHICRGVYPRKRHHRIDPATRTFQALRIAVNDELGQLERILPQAITRLQPGGRAVVIAFHSLEDRIVKNVFRDHARAGGYKLITRKPLRPTEEEVSENPPSRSARLRVLERTEDEP